jgi:hypothetical protein
MRADKILCAKEKFPWLSCSLVSSSNYCEANRPIITSKLVLTFEVLARRSQVSLTSVRRWSVTRCWSTGAVLWWRGDRESLRSWEELKRTIIISLDVFAIYYHSFRHFVIWHYFWLWCSVVEQRRDYNRANLHYASTSHLILSSFHFPPLLVSHSLSETKEANNCPGIGPHIRFGESFPGLTWTAGNVCMPFLPPTLLPDSPPWL